MSEHPILFSGPMVRAILDGTKTQTRRVVKPQPPTGFAWSPLARLFYRVGDGLGLFRKCPYGVPGDTLWVRETWARVPWSDAGQEVHAYLYRADNPPRNVWDPERGDRWRPSIFMPREACRLFLRVTDVRVERVQEITEGGAKAEGVPGSVPSVGVARAGFRDLWDSINAKRGYGWDANPWVWVVTFEGVPQ